jgi:hypothetical protein
MLPSASSPPISSLSPRQRHPPRLARRRPISSARKTRCTHARISSWRAKRFYITFISQSHSYLLTGFKSFSEVYGEAALCPGDQFVGKRGNRTFPGVRVITAAPEIEGVIPAMEELSRRGVICAIGHRYVVLCSQWFHIPAHSLVPRHRILLARQPRKAPGS